MDKVKSKSDIVFEVPEGKLKTDMIFHGKEVFINGKKDKLKKSYEDGALDDILRKGLSDILKIIRVGIKNVESGIKDVEKDDIIKLIKYLFTSLYDLTDKKNYTKGNIYSKNFILSGFLIELSNIENSGLEFNDIFKKILNLNENFGEKSVGYNMELKDYLESFYDIYEELCYSLEEKLSKTRNIDNTEKSIENFREQAKETLEF